MKKYVICMDHGADYNAASKARQDAEEILLSRGFEPLTLHVERTADGNLRKQIWMIPRFFSSWRQAVRQAEPGSLIVLQYPFFPIKTVWILSRLVSRARKKKGLRFLALIHDLNSLRGFYGRAAAFSDNRFLKRFDHMISHNRKMTDYLRNTGIPGEKITELELFDYLTDAVPREHGRKDGVTVAGNLDPEKSGYISRLIRLSGDEVPVHLYGRGLTGKNEIKNVIYHGAFAPEILPGELEGAFGLVWDGSSAETCEGPTGNYLRYNNPHKLSLYLSAGMPVIIWKEAAEADLVRENRVGLTVAGLDGLHETINRISEANYALLVENAKQIGEKIRNGHYLAAAMKAAEAKLEGKHRA